MPLQIGDAAVFISVYVRYVGGCSCKSAMVYLHTMPVQNRIIKVQKRNRALVTFNGDRICGAILRAAQSIGGFQQDFLPEINGTIFEIVRFGRKDRGVHGGHGDSLS